MTPPAPLELKKSIKYISTHTRAREEKAKIPQGIFLFSSFSRLKSRLQIILFFENLLSLPLRPQPKQEIPLPFVPSAAAASTGQVRDVRVVGQHLRDILLGLDPPNLNHTIAALSHGLGNDIGRLTLTLGSNDVGLTFLLGLLDNEPCAFGFLLRNLLLFNGFGEFAAEGHVGDADVFQGDVEVGGAFEQVGADLVRDGFTLRDQFGGVELGDDGFEDFVADGGEDTLVVVLAEGLEGSVSTGWVGNWDCVMREYAE